MTNRGPIDPKACGEAVAAWLDHTGNTDEADIALEAALLTQGVLNPADIAEGMYFQRDSREHRVVHIQLGDGDWLEITPQGVVTLL